MSNRSCTHVFSGRSLEKSAKAKGIEIKVETQGAIGIENKITLADVKNADVVILTKDIEIEGVDRFKGKPIFKIGVNDLVRKPNQIIEKVQAYF